MFEFQNIVPLLAEDFRDFAARPEMFEFQNFVPLLAEDFREFAARPEMFEFQNIVPLLAEDFHGFAARPEIKNRIFFCLSSCRKFTFLWIRRLSSYA